ncbi:hypothetical protein E8E13_004292 [Curvularia kusanoi]|uniref:Uncharacterized protein n=1 Tax=Curvularia kusanoi TaxID=90978 RepID=A0A9P4TKU2_CURKU|nr:hypothetical protein E8E13_004292 [Curvularia kusanoi]
MSPAQRVCAHAANRFSILAGVSPSPDNKWAFEFVSTPRSSIKRRGKRGGKHLKSKSASKEAHERSKAHCIDELCDQFSALRLDGNEPTANGVSPAKPSGCYTTDLSTVRHHWAPQFRPNSVPKSTFAQKDTSKPLIQQPISSLPLILPIPTASSSVAVATPDSMLAGRMIANRFPLSAFLRDITSPTDCAGFWPPQSHKLGSASASYSQGSAGQPVTSAQPTAVAAPCCNSQLLADSTLQPHDAVSAHGEGPLSLLLAIKSTTVQTDSLASPPDPDSMMVSSSSSSGSTTKPFATKYSIPVDPRTVTPESLGEDFVADTVVGPSLLRRRLASGTPSPKIQKEVEEFLNMGHAEKCWCSGGGLTEIKAKAPHVTTHAEGLSSQTKAADGPHILQAGSSDAVVHMLEAFTNTLEVTDSDISHGDAVMVSPSHCGFEEFEILDGYPIDSEDEEWLAISPGLRAHHPNSLSTSRSTSDASVQVLLAPSHVPSPSTALLSPPQTPLLSASQTDFSGVESEAR